MTGPLITTAVAGSVHPRCGTPVLTGIAEGLLARVDLTPLNRAGEIRALIAGLQTYTLTRTGLVHRDACRIAGTALTGPVLAEHACHHRIPAEHRASTAAVRTAPPTEGIPF